MTRHALVLPVAIVVLVLSPGISSADELRLVPTTSLEGLQVGDLTSFEIYLDTQERAFDPYAGIKGFTIRLSFDAGVIAYRPDLSTVAYYPLYAPGRRGGKHWDYYPSWLFPLDDPPVAVPGAGSSHIDLSWRGQYGRGNGFPVPAVGTATNELLAQLTFEAVAPGSARVDWGFGDPGTVYLFGGATEGPVFIEPGDGEGSALDIRDAVSTPGSTVVTVIPEPATLVLIGAGLAVLAIHRRQR